MPDIDPELWILVHGGGLANAAAWPKGGSWPAARATMRLLRDYVGRGVPEDWTSEQIWVAKLKRAFDRLLALPPPPWYHDSSQKTDPRRVLEEAEEVFDSYVEQCAEHVDHDLWRSCFEGRWKQDGHIATRLSTYVGGALQRARPPGLEIFQKLLSYLGANLRPEVRTAFMDLLVEELKGVLDA